MKRAIGIIAVAMLSSGLLAPAARALDDPAEMLASPVLEHRAEAVGEQLRCMVCQDESVEESSADLAKDFRRIIRQQIAAGRTNRQVIDWMVARYGDFIRMDPPFDALTFLLWGAPVLALATGAGAVLISRRRPSSPPSPLSAAERERLNALLDG